MTEDIKPEVLKKTQTALNKYIKKPPLTDKLLKKPPFRFLHDIITSVIRETGFLNGVFTSEELIADNVKDKESKIKFLTKLIAAVKDSTGNNIKAKPGKIVAGLEVDKTLELLQAIAKGIGSQTNGNKSVSNNQNDKNKPKKDPETENDKSKVVNEKKESQRSDGSVKERKRREKNKDDNKEVVEKADDKRKREKSEKRNKPEKKDKTEKEGKQNLKEVKRRESFSSGPDIKGIETEKEDTKNIIESNSTESSPTEKPTLESKQFSKERSVEAVEISKQPSVDLNPEDVGTPKKEEEIVFRHKEIDNKVEETNIQNDETKKDTISETPPRRPSTRRSSSRSLKNTSKKNDSIEKVDNGSDKVDGKAAESLNVDAVDMKAKNQNKDTNTNETKVIPPSAVERPRTARRAPPVLKPPSARPRSGRPSSVRPGAPKTRDRGEVAVEQNKEREDEAKEVVVITENDKVEEDKEDMVVLESQALNLEEGGIIEDVSSSAGEGVLVDILETESILAKKKPKSIDIEWENGHKEKREAWRKECDQLRSGIQSLTRSTGPLGKLFDFLQEDVDLATRELSYWRQASVTYASQLEAEKRLNDESLNKHRKKLSELAGQIEEEQEAIRAVKASILANDKKILNLISRSPLSQ